MKLAKLILASSLVASCAFAEGAFIGVGGGYNFNAEFQTEDDLSIDGNQGVFSVKGGYDFGSYRSYAQYNYNSKYSEEVSVTQGGQTTLLGKAEFSGHEFVVGVDFTPALSENFKLSVGPYAGLSLLKATAADQTGSESQTQKGFIVGGKAGVIFDFGAGEIEAGVKADKAWHSGQDGWVDIDKTTLGAYAGYNFKF
ncbi:MULTISPECIES: outer membrane beta-barrel protein [unclassified Campylobacter]|uniref:outer membrane beta-barrel protein n=1 Tax=unclassified Campylobacter TaxID=2593542 RepID=UPI0022E9A44B|nr:MULTISPECIES: outer membrane beta-barrel protein [unclassified Campylobacter]MBR2156720.1 hypothetical protein [Campylobacter sp.]MDA3079445.1 outer membrane beta-barrel protein [Campylobacter sp. CS_NA2]MDA3081122.1 outer membrane beta-barrel protein [Campylobacter sp. CS_NA1]MDA3085673.1 outer membrane beta-barrel protein [Campylobacter sp. CS_ED1]MDA3090279.1 outer membrane beta-barrel protein [Campylobacter sp. CS_ED2]